MRSALKRSGNMAANFDCLTTTASDLQACYAAGTLTTTSVLPAYQVQIDHHELDEERKKSGPRSPMHGIPVLVKDKCLLSIAC